MSEPAEAPRVLVADDQPDVLQAVRLLLKGEGYRVETASSPAAVARQLQEHDFDVVLLDLNYARDTTSGAEGMDLLRRIRAVHPSLPLVVMTAWGSVDGAVEAMRVGARDYVEKPWDNHRLLATIRAQVELGRALRTARHLEDENRRLTDDVTSAAAVVAESRAMRDVLAMVRRIAPSDASVLITGEHGTGKEVIARRLHAESARSSRPLVTVHAGGIATGVVESELFGHVKGAFTDAKTERIGYFESAHRGTLFLDEIGTMPMSLQAKLLRVLQTGEFQRVGSSQSRTADVRLISATNLDLHQEVAEGRFRGDLLYRINTVEIHVPPLRERRDDVPVLAEQFLRAFAQRYGKRLAGFDSDAMRALLDYAWPGNVRELSHTVERAVLLAGGDRVAAPDLNLRPPASRGGDGLEDMPLEEVERHLIRKALERYGGNVSHAAEALGISRSALYRRLQKHGLE
ncbi:MAG TPA: sigma-54 dependent transcriptional regulator [Longimicrobium sp.]|nr:sigma-54 dependent transcriptional regulator [Longimicrobium sp.]